MGMLLRRYHDTPEGSPAGADGGQADAATDETTDAATDETTDEATDEATDETADEATDEDAPAGNASKEEWAAYRQAHDGLTAEEADGMSRDDLRDYKK